MGCIVIGDVMKATLVDMLLVIGEFVIRIQYRMRNESSASPELLRKSDFLKHAPEEGHPFTPQPGS
jgi:hypothetical protein